MTSQDVRQEIAVSGKTKDMSVLIEIFRQRGIPYRQSPSFARGPVFCIPLAYETQVRALLKENEQGRSYEILDAKEVESTRTLFWIIIMAALGFILIPWLRVLLVHYHLKH